AERRGIDGWSRYGHARAVGWPLNERERLCPPAIGPLRLRRPRVELEGAVDEAAGLDPDQAEAVEGRRPGGGPAARQVERPAREPSGLAHLGVRVPGEDEVAALGKVIAGVRPLLAGVRLVLVPPVGRVVDEDDCRGFLRARGEADPPRCLEDFEVRLTNP